MDPETRLPIEDFYSQFENIHHYQERQTPHTPWYEMMGVQSAAESAAPPDTQI